MKVGRPFVFAGFGKGGNRLMPKDWIRTCTIITGKPNDLIREIHTRMSVILPEDKLNAGYQAKSERKFWCSFRQTK
jgi:putative SOS response-associated peptidase YedK